MLIWSAPRSRELHVFILPDGRGEWGFSAAREVIEYAAWHGIALLWARIDPTHRALALYARIGGMRPTGEVIEAHGVDYGIYALEVPSCLQQ